MKAYIQHEAPRGKADGGLAPPSTRFDLFPCTKKFRKNAALRTGTARLIVDCSMYHP